MTTNNQDHFQNDNISVTVKREPGCRVHLDIKVTPQAVRAARSKALKSINKEVSIPGFRKGRAPEAVVEERFANYIDKEWRQTVLETSFSEAINLIKIFPFTKDSVYSANLKSISLDEGATLSYEFEERPHLPPISPHELSQLHVPPVPRQPVKDADINHVIDDLCLRHAEWNDVNDRPVQEGDFVDIDIDILSEPARNACTDARLAVAPGKMEGWMRRLIVGMTPGQTVEGMSEKEDKHKDCHGCDDPTHHHNEEFKPALCRFTVHAIKQAKIPPFDDELAKKFGANGADDLKEKVKTNLNRRAEEEQKNSQRVLMQQALLNKYHVDVPRSFVQNAGKNQRKQIIDSLRADGVAESEILAEATKIEEEISRRAQHDFQLHFLLQNIAHENKIAVADDEVMMEYLQHMWQQKSGQSQSQLPENPEEAKAQIHTQLLLLKTLDFLLEKQQQQ